MSKFHSLYSRWLVLAIRSLFLASPLPSWKTGRVEEAGGGVRFVTRELKGWADLSRLSFGQKLQMSHTRAKVKSKDEHRHLHAGALTPQLPALRQKTVFLMPILEYHIEIIVVDLSRLRAMIGRTQVPVSSDAFGWVRGDDQRTNTRLAWF